YWNEDLGEDGAVLLTDLTDLALDKNGNDTLDITSTLPTYGQGLTSYPSLGVDNGNGIILAFTAIQEDFADNVNTAGLNFRHTVVSRSDDNGVTWQAPIDLSESPYGISELSPISEIVYGTLYPYEVNGEMHMIYQRDFIPGLAVIGDMHTNLGSSIHYVSFPADLVASSEEIEGLVEFELFPNPTSGNLHISFENNSGESLQVFVTDMMGKRLQALFTCQADERKIERDFHLALSPGLYFIEIQGDKGASTKKVLVR
ncbi:MAG: T9SS type A sorting domain-containing protein, partial [Saprospiraceae bacterium]|nr:T9SS type A sorting domain-containing protein [Saprospiraceae bacterium]